MASASAKHSGEKSTRSNRRNIGVVWGSPTTLIATFEPTASPRSKIIGRVNEARLNFLIESFRELGFAPSIAKHRARIAYAALLGHRRLQGGVSSQIGASATKSFGVELIDALTSDARSD